MRKVSLLLSIAVLAAMILAACGGEATSTNLPSTNVPPVTAEVTGTSPAGAATATESSAATEVPTEGTTTATTETPGIPVTGAVNSDRLSNELKFKVLDQSGEQVGKVDEMVLDLSRAKVLYVVVNAGGKKIPVPWAFLKVGPASASSYPNEQQNTFILQAATDTLKNAPEFNPKNVPGLGQAPDSWDYRMRKYWEGGGATSSNNTPVPAGTAATDTTATATSSSSAGTGTGLATATSSAGGAGTSPAASAGTTQGTGTGQGAITIQGVQLASQVLGAKVTVGVQVLAPGATGAGTGSATSTPSSAGTSVATATSSTGTSQTTSTPSPKATAATLSATINDMIVNTDLGEIMYIVIKTSFDDGEHLIPVPLRLLQLNSSGPASDTSQTGNNGQSFVLNIDATTLQNAPFFKSDQFPDLTAPAWNSEFDAFWQNSSSGTGAQVTATATP